MDTRDDPTALTLISCDAIAHDWKSPLSSSIRNPKSAIRNRFAPGQPFTQWTHEAISLNPEITLINQPRFIQLEYRIIAVNAGGVSVPSNVVAVVV